MDGYKATPITTLGTCMSSRAAERADKALGKHSTEAPYIMKCKEWVKCFFFITNFEKEHFPVK